MRLGACLTLGVGGLGCFCFAWFVLRVQIFLMWVLAFIGLVDLGFKACGAVNLGWFRIFSAFEFGAFCPV